MKKSLFRKAVFFVVYKIENGRVKYLLLKRKLHWVGWEFPKGGVKKYETFRRAIRRETLEETGLEAIKIKKHNYSGKYLYGETLRDRPEYLGQTYSLYSVLIGEGKTKIDKHEHSGFEWLSYSEALKKLYYEDQRKSLKIVNEWLMRKN